MLKFLAILFFVNCVYCEEFCTRTNNSCSFMFGKEYPDDFCWKVYYDINNQSVCDAAYDENAVRTNTKNYGRLILNPFVPSDDIRTIFNISFVDIKFGVLKIRFQEYNFKNGTTIKYHDTCMVKDFILKDSVPADKTFSYVCPWRDASYEGRFLDFHYEYGVNEYETRKKYKFWVPKHEYLTVNSKTLYFFTYMDYSDINNLTLNIVPAQKRFNVTQYKVEVIYTNNGESDIKISDILTAADSVLLEYSYYTSGTVGAYHFRVEPISNYCQQNACKIEETPRIEIRDESSTLLIGMVGVSLMIPIFMIILYMWFPRPGQKPANVLLVTVPTNDAHVLIAPAFAEFLQETYGVNVMLDIKDVPRTFTRNSFDWLKLAINHASHVIFLRSNDDLPANKVIYQDTYVQTMHLLNPKSNPIRKKECIIYFPYSSETTEISHLELVHITNRFIFKEPCNKLMDFLFNKKVALIKTDNCAYQNLLAAIKYVENERPVNKYQQKAFGVQPQVSDDDDDDDDHLGQKDLLGDIENNKSSSVKVDIDLDINLFGESNNELNKTNDENNSDNDLDELNLYGNI